MTKRYLNSPGPEVFLDVDRRLPSQRNLLAELQHTRLRLAVAILAGAMGWLFFFVVVFLR